MAQTGDQPELGPSAYMAMAMVRDGINTGYAIKQMLERVASLLLVRGSSQKNEATRSSICLIA